MSIVDSSFGLYVILTAPVRGYEYLTQLCVDHEVAFVQLREKYLPRAGMVWVAEKMRLATAGTKTKFIVNDDVELAQFIEADGVHLGQGDMRYEEARALLGPSAIIGLSTHTPEQTRQACALKPDYIGIGPVFATPTKLTPDQPIGIAGMQEMLALATVPAVVLGSINPHNLAEILHAGARNFASVRPINEAKEPERVLGELLRIYRRQTAIQ